MPSDPLIVIARLADIFDQLGIPYLVGGSLASSVYGIPRATNDADLVADVKNTHVQLLQNALDGDFYSAEELILDAIRQRGSFNVIHLANNAASLKFLNFLWNLMPRLTVFCM